MENTFASLFYEIRTKIKAFGFLYVLKIFQENDTLRRFLKSGGNQEQILLGTIKGKIGEDFSFVESSLKRVKKLYQEE